jgi:hypothetical protein
MQRYYLLSPSGFIAAWWWCPPVCWWMVASSSGSGEWRLTAAAASWGTRPIQFAADDCCLAPSLVAALLWFWFCRFFGVVKGLSLRSCRGFEPAVVISSF